jgi:spore cortex biosynthesis protein YabQ
MENLTIQYALFFYSIFIGVYLGVSYDIFEMFLLKYLNQVLRAILQIGFFILQAMLVFKVLFNINRGVIPLYSYFLFLVGFLIYSHFSSQYHESNLVHIEKIYKYSIKKLKQIFAFLVIEPFIDIYNALKIIGRWLLRIFKFILYKFKPLLKILKPVMNRLNPKFLTKYVKIRKKKKKNFKKIYNN